MENVQKLLKNNLEESNNKERKTEKSEILINLNENLLKIADVYQQNKILNDDNKLELNLLIKTIFLNNNYECKEKYTLSDDTTVDYLISARGVNENFIIDTNFPLNSYKTILANINNPQIINKETSIEEFKKIIEQKIEQLKHKLNNNKNINQAIFIIPFEEIYLNIIKYLGEKIISFGLKNDTIFATPMMLVCAAQMQSNSKLKSQIDIEIINDKVEKLAQGQQELYNKLDKIEKITSIVNDNNIKK